MIFNKNRVDEDLEKIKRTNLPHNQSKVYDNQNNELNLEKGDITAMIIAVMSLILPYVISFVGIMGIAVYLLAKFYG